MPQDYSNLAPEYTKMFLECQIREKSDKEHPVAMSQVADFALRLLKGATKYQDAAQETKIPWYVIGLIHGLEGDFDFSTHLHNGDSLQHKTVNVPRGRPDGTPPFTWKESSVDALNYDNFTSWHDWTVAGILFKIESYNGWGYRRHEINSPYLWSGSLFYDRGKYSSDGIYDKNLVSKQAGAAVALKYLTQNHDIALEAQKA